MSESDTEKKKKGLLSVLVERLLAGVEKWSNLPEVLNGRRPLRYAALTVQLGLELKRGFRARPVSVGAHALTYTTVLSIIPLMAVLLYILRQVGMWEQMRDNVLPGIIKNYPEMSRVSEYIIAYVERTDFDSMGLAGGFFLFYTTLSMIGQIEKAFNRTWEINKSRNPLRKISDYLLVLIFVPTLISFGISFNSLLLETAVAYLPMLKDMAGSALSDMLSMLFLGLGLTLLLFFLPNRKVPIWAALISGFSGGLLFFWMTRIYFGLQVGVANYNMIYSSLAVLPVSIIFIDLVWHIVLLSCEFCRALHTVRLRNYQSVKQID